MALIKSSVALGRRSLDIPALSARARLGLGVAVLMGLLVLVVVVSAAQGPAEVPFAHVLAILLADMGINAGVDYSAKAELVVDQIRLPRIITAGLVGIALATASLAGAMLIVIGPVEPSMGRLYIGRVFAIVVLGGMGSVGGTLIAALLLGVIESLTATFYGPSWAPAVAFGFLLFALAVRPQGLFGR